MVAEDKVAYHLAETRKFAGAALVEFERWEKEKSDLIIRGAAEKAWKAVLQATNALLLGRGFPEEKIKTHRDRRLSLDSLESRDLEVKCKGLSDRFGAREHRLHERCFYEGEYVPEKVGEDIWKAKTYIEDIEKILETSS